MFSRVNLPAFTPQNWKVIAAAYLGWTLDAFDFFIMVFALGDIIDTFGASPKLASLAITLTLAARPIGAFVFGLCADRFGRRPVLMIDVLIYSALEFASGLAPTLTTLFIIRFLFGIAMGGEWGTGASLTLESVPPKVRGFVSGLLQAGYPSGYLLASLLYFTAYTTLGWRGMFMAGSIPALLVLFIRRHVAESPAFNANAARVPLRQSLRGQWRRVVWAVLMMAAFNYLSHGTQDVYPTFMKRQMHFDAHTAGLIAIIYNIGALLGGIVFGALSDRIGRRRAIAIAALLAVPAIPLWARGRTPVMLAAGAFLVQFFAQGAWGVVPVHLNELAPGNLRGTFPGVVYQLGNLLAAANATLQTGYADMHHGDYRMILMLVAGTAAIAVAVLASIGPERRGVRFGGEAENETLH